MAGDHRRNYTEEIINCAARHFDFTHAVRTNTGITVTRVYTTAVRNRNYPGCLNSFATAMNYRGIARNRVSRPLDVSWTSRFFRCTFG